MITRIVQLEFKEETIDDFLNFFETIKEVVNTYPGCLGMKLYRDTERPAVVLTYSHWESEEALERYRNSTTFSEIWPYIKPWFGGRPLAWSVKAHFDGFKALKDE